MSIDMKWIAVDWGTSHVRAWAMDAQNTPLEMFHSDKGMGKLTPDQYEDALVELMGGALPDRPLDVVICGMAGAKQGWSEAPYAQTPCLPPTADIATRVSVQKTNLNVYILPGVSQDQPADVMRGEETQIAGFMAANPQFDGVVCLPGTHTKWAHVSAGEIVSFRTFMTGETFALLSTQSVLRHSVGGDDWEPEIFGEAVGKAYGRPGSFAAQLFSLRAESLLHDLTPSQAKARLSGLLIGLELAGSKPYWLGQAIALVGANSLSTIYKDALALQGAEAAIVDAEAMTLAGLTAAYSKLKDASK